jgi:hypothetical protein
MLLELHAVNESLRSAGVSAGATDNRIQGYPNRPALEVLVDPDGSVVDIRLMERDKVGAIRKFECSTGGLRESTPGFNCEPLYRLSANADGQAFDESLRQLRRALKAPEGSAGASEADCERLLGTLKRLCEPNWDLSDRSKIGLCLSKAATVLLHELSSASDPELMPLLELLKRSQLLNVRSLHQGVAAAIERNLISHAAAAPAQELLKILYSPVNARKNPKSGSGSVSLILELADRASSMGPANHELTWIAVNNYLVERRTSELAILRSSSATVAVAARTGIFGEPILEKLGPMPERTVPRLGKVKLFSLSDQTPCQSRYGLAESEACPVGEDVQSQLASALAWVTATEREQKTWADVSDSCGYKFPALLVAYARKLPSAPVHLAALFAPDAREGNGEFLQECRFEARTSPLLQALSGLPPADGDAPVTVVVISKVDPARKKIMYSRQLTARHLVRAAQGWQAAARNCPPVRIGVSGPGTKPSWYSALTPYPSQVVRIINTCWDSDGTTPKQVSNARIGLGLALLLETGESLQQAAGEALRRLIPAVTPVILALGRAHSEGKAARFPKRYCSVPPLIPATLGLVLAKLDILKGTYMSRNHYLIGRLFSTADEFHRQYCQHARDGAIPSGRLLGNALMSTALDNPTQALARLAERLLLYQTVADSDLRNKAGQIESAIDKSELPTTCNDAEKAQLLLGYLARPDLQPLDKNGDHIAEEQPS